MCSERVHAGNFPFTNLANTLHCTLYSALQCGRFVRGDFLAWGSVLAGGLYKSIYLDKSGHINRQCFYYFHRRSTTRDCCGTSAKPSGPDTLGCAIRLCSTWDNQSNYLAKYSCPSIKINCGSKSCFDSYHVLPLLSLLLQAPCTFPYLSNHHLLGHSLFHQDAE